MAETVRPGGRHIDHYECRHCGLNVVEGVTECPTCGRSIAHYALEAPAMAQSRQ